MQNAGDEYVCLWMCFVDIFCVRSCVYIRLCGRVVHMLKCAHLQTHSQMEVCVKVCLPRMMEREGSLSFNIVLLGPYVSAWSWQLRPCAPSTPPSSRPCPQPPPPPPSPPPIFHDWRLLLSRAAEAQTQTRSVTSLGSHVFITVFVLMMSPERDRVQATDSLIASVNTTGCVTSGNDCS